MYVEEVAFGLTWSCSLRTVESPSSGSAGGVLIVTDFSERLSLLRDLWWSRLRSLWKRTKGLGQRSGGVSIRLRAAQTVLVFICVEVCGFWFSLGCLTLTS